MAWHPRAVHRPLPRTSPPMTPTAGITHSDAGYVESLYGWWTNPASGGLSCHAHVSWDGVLEQYIDTEREACANVEANAYGISVEVSNSPDYRDGKVSFDGDPYSPAQIAALVDWWTWALTTHKTIPPEKCADGRRGLGWHDQYPQWTTPGHVCPGRRRIEQLQTDIWPQVFRAIGHAPAPAPVPQEDDMPAFAIMEIPADGAPHVVPVPPPQGGAAGWGDVWVSLIAASGDPHATAQVWAVAAVGTGYQPLPGLAAETPVGPVRRAAAKLAPGTEAVVVAVKSGPAVSVMVEATARKLGA